MKSSENRFKTSSNPKGVASHVFILSAPSGGGKNTVIKRLMTKDQDLQYIVSATSRNPRKGEVNGRDYHFLSEETFEEMIRSNAFVEWAKVYDRYYGTLKKEVNDVLHAGKDGVMDVDVQGALALRQKLKTSVLIFLLPPSLAVLEARLRQRKTESEEEIVKRMQKVREEIAYADYYDYQIINQDLDSTVESIEAIIKEHKQKRSMPNDRYFD